MNWSIKTRCIHCHHSYDKKDLVFPCFIIDAKDILLQKIPVWMFWRKLFFTYRLKGTSKAPIRIGFICIPCKEKIEKESDYGN